MPDVGHLLVNPLPLLLLVLTVSDVTDELREPTHRHLEGSLLEGNEKKEKSRDFLDPGMNKMKGPFPTAFGPLCFLYM